MISLDLALYNCLFLEWGIVMRIIKFLFGVFFLIEAIVSFGLLFIIEPTGANIIAWFFIIFLFAFPAYLCLKKPKNAKNQPDSEASIHEHAIPSAQPNFQTAEPTNNISLNRTDREEDLCVKFMMEHKAEIKIHTDNFEDCYRMAHETDDLNQKISLLEKTITEFEKSKKWFYTTKGGTIYFQDFYEHLHNTQSPDFSYIDIVQESLDYFKRMRDYVIPHLMHILSSQESIMQKDIYKLLPDVSREDIQAIIKELEYEDKVSRVRKGNSYLITLLHGYNG